MLLEPQALAQHFMHGVADRVFVAADNRLDLHARGAQALLQRIGGVQDLGHGTLTTATALPGAPRKGGGEDSDQQHQDDDCQASAPVGRACSLPWPPARGKFELWMALE